MSEVRKYIPYVSPVLCYLLTFFMVWLVTPVAGKTIVYLLLLLIITFSTWYSGLKIGLLTSLLSTITLSYFFFFHFQKAATTSVMTTAEIGLFTFCGTIFCFILDKYKNVENINELKKELEVKSLQLQRLEAESEKMRQEIKLRDEFLSIASHELKTPLTSMLLKLQNILHNIRSVSLANFSVANLLEMLETAEQQTQRLSRMINDLLNISLITTGKLTLDIKTFNLSTTVKEVVNEFSEKLEKGGYSLKVIAENQVDIHADKMRIEQVITNLISNAIKYGDGKPISVQVKSNNSKAWVIVEDKGIGIPEHQIDKVFALFERGVTDTKYKGLGVGLFITNQIVKAHHGSISINSKPHDGSTFIVELPVSHAHEKSA